MSAWEETQKRSKEASKKNKIKYILLKKGEKIPIEKWKENNYSYDDLKLIKHREINKNYGVVLGNGLIVIDADTKRLNDIIIEKFPKTFTVKTKNGFHYYYYCDDFEQKRVLNDKEGHLGEIQTKGQYVVGEGSIHPSGIVYSVSNDIPIVKIERSFIDEHLKKYYSSLKIDKKQIIKEGSNKGNRNDDLFKLACEYVKKGITKEEVSIILNGINQKNKIPLQYNEVETILNSAFSYKKVKNNSNINIEVLQLLGQSSKKTEATEMLVKLFMENNYIHSLRNDNEKEMWIYHKGIYIPDAQTYIREFIRSLTGDVYTTQLCNQVISKIEVDTFTTPQELFKEEDLNLIPLQNGIYDLKTNKMIEFSYKFRFFNKLPIEYDKNLDCVGVKDFFKSCLGHEEDIECMQELFGWLMYRDYSFEKAYMFDGIGRNGKGKTIELMKRFIGSENCSNLSLDDIENDMYAVSGMFKKLANLSGDISKKAMKNTGMFKMLTGRDTIDTARKNLTRLKFVNYAKIVVACNELPKTHDITNAFFDRWIRIKYPYRFLDKENLEKEREITLEHNKIFLKLQDPEIINKISTKEEISGLFNWALIGLKRILKNKQLMGSRSSEETKHKWQRDSSSLEAFLMDRTEKDFEGEIIKSEFRKEYSKYCHSNSRKVETDKAIKYILESKGFWETRTEGIRKYNGIKLNQIQPNQPNRGFQPYREISNSIVKLETMVSLDRLDLKNEIKLKTKKQEKKVIEATQPKTEEIHIKDEINVFLQTKLDRIKEFMLTQNDLVTLEELKKFGFSIDLIEKACYHGYLSSPIKDKYELGGK